MTPPVMTSTIAPSHTNAFDTRLAVTHEQFIAHRPAHADEDVHMHQAVTDYALKTFSEPGDLVFDPFAGFGTTLTRSLELGRTALGIELLPERVEALANLGPDARAIEGDARELLRLVPRDLVGGRIALVLTSPPYMAAHGAEPDPLTAYEADGGDYARYLTELELVAAQCARVVAPGGYVVWNVADLKSGDKLTPLIDDCSALLSQHLSPVTRTEIAWDRYPHDLVRDALLVFRREHQ
ncbi:DNA methyltransferase [Leucobacter chinensis]|uniref:DNA methyltransferase n=1 Tax=Leucobacter chinensis TaxID=2851010 RepID=UPI0020B7D79F|nr:DNA methyltransferase [Leucobacter chinensis]